MPDEKLKNKVVCDFHFKQSFFMNYKREKLNKTNAIPTIYITDDEEIDLMETPMDWVESNRAQVQMEEVFPSQKNIDMDDDRTLSEELIEYEVTSSPPPRKKVKVEVNNAPVKILNIEAIQHKVKVEHSTPKPKPTLPTVPTITTKQRIMKVVPPKECTIRRVSPKKVQHFAEVSEDLPVLIAYEPEEEQDEVASSSNMDEIKSMLLQCTKDNAEIKKLLVKQQQKQDNQGNTSLTQQDSSNITQSHLNKVQLFNGIKRYLSPAMVALLRMDMFTSLAKREFKPDEKVICTEILQFGNEFYSFLLDEWRLRLPPRETVEKWIEEKQQQDENDAS